MRVLLLGDGIGLTTGFSQVLRQVAAACVERGWDVHQLAALDTGPAYDVERYRAQGVTPHFPCQHDFTGRTLFSPVLERVRPDVIFLLSDPGTAATWQHECTRRGVTAPVVLYAPIEGAPIAPTYADAFRWAAAAYTCTQWASETLQREHDLAIPWVHHGVDTTVFRPLDEGERRRVRRELGWEGRFVVSYVARNAGRKAQDRLIKALRLIRDAGHRDVLLYLHCRSYDDHQLQGWDLRGVAHACGVTSAVQFADQADAARGEAPVSLAAKYAASDVYVHAAKVEGFGLPILEAMASGLPVVIPADGGNMEEVGGPGVAMKITPRDWDTWFTTAQLANVHPEQFAAGILALKAEPKLRRAASAQAIEWAKRFDWGTMRLILADVIAATAAGKDVEMVLSTLAAVS